MGAFMILCICNNIRDTDIKNNPEIASLIGSCCGRCLIDTTAAANTRFIDATKSSVKEIR
jgi:bacterioferritin-associated ferredoxin